MCVYENDNNGDLDRRIGGMYDSRRTCYGLDFDAYGLRAGRAEGLYRVRWLEGQKGISGLLLQLALSFIIASFLTSCTSAGNAPLQERNEQLVCSSYEQKICPSAAGTASRIRTDEGVCYCAPREHLQN
jgi:hypothetical protein